MHKLSGLVAAACTMASCAQSPTLVVSDEELSQGEWVSLMGASPLDNIAILPPEWHPEGSLLGTCTRNEILGDQLPAVCFPPRSVFQLCNAASQRDGLEPAYTVDATSVQWHRGANGWRLPTVDEWKQYSGGPPAQDALCEGNFGRLMHSATRPFIEDVSCPPDSWPFMAPVRSGTPDPSGRYHVRGNAAEYLWSFSTMHAGGEPGNVTEAPPDRVTFEGSFINTAGGTWYAEPIRWEQFLSGPMDKGSATAGVRLVRTGPAR